MTTKHNRKVIFKFSIIISILVLLFLVIFVIDCEKNYAPPWSDLNWAVNDPLKIVSAYFQPKSSLLFLCASNRWAVIDIDSAVEENKTFREVEGISPRNCNVIHRKDFKTGGIPKEKLEDAEPVALETSTFVCYNPFGQYNWSQSIGADARKHIWYTQHDPNSKVNLPTGYSYALFDGVGISGNEYLPLSAYYLKNYFFLTPILNADDRYWVRFFYDYDPQYKYYFKQKPEMTELLFFFGPSFFALCIALPLAFSRVRTIVALPLFILAFLAHLVSSGLFLFAIGMGGGHDGGKGVSFFVFGNVVLVILAVIKIIFMPQNLSTPEGNRNGES